MAVVAASTCLTLAEVENELREVTAADWFPLGVQLGIRPAKLREIEKDHPGDVQRCKTEVLDWWHRNTPEISWRKVAQALEAMGGYVHLAQRLERSGNYALGDPHVIQRNGSSFHPELVASQGSSPITNGHCHSGSDAGGNIYDDALTKAPLCGCKGIVSIHEPDLELETHFLRSKFNVLFTKVRRSLEQQGVQVDDFISFLKGVPAYTAGEQSLFSAEFPGLYQKRSLTSVFDQVRDYTSWFNYSFISDIIDTYCENNKSIRKALQEFQQLLQRYCKHRVCKCSLRNGFGFGRKRACAHMVLKIDKEWKTIRVKQVEEVTSNLARILNVHRRALYLRSVENGCVQLTFVVSNALASAIFPLSQEQEVQLVEIGVILLHCGDHQFLNPPLGFTVATPSYNLTAQLISCTELLLSSNGRVLELFHTCDEEMLSVALNLWVHYFYHPFTSGILPKGSAECSSAWPRTSKAEEDRVATAIHQQKLPETFTVVTSSMALPTSLVDEESASVGNKLHPGERCSGQDIYLQLNWQGQEAPDADRAIKHQKLPEIFTVVTSSTPPPTSLVDEQSAGVGGNLHPGELTQRSIRSGQDILSHLSRHGEEMEDYVACKDQEASRSNSADGRKTIHVGPLRPVGVAKSLSRLAVRVRKSLVKVLSRFKPRTKISKFTKRLELGAQNTDHTQHFVVAYAELLRRANEPLGLVLHGGADCDMPAHIGALTPGGVAEMSGALQVGDHVLSINGTPTEHLDNSEVEALLKNVGNVVNLEISFKATPGASLDDLMVKKKNATIILPRERNSFGFTISGGRTEDRPITVSNVTEYSLAYKNGVLKVGDRITKVNGNDVSQASQMETLSLLEASKDSCSLEIEYDVTLHEGLSEARDALLVELLKPKGASLGISLSGCPAHGEPIWISHVKEASIADRCGALHLGDRLLSVNGVILGTAQEAIQTLLHSDIHIKLEIIPSHNFPDVPDERLGEASFTTHSYILSHPENMIVSLKADNIGFGLSLQGGASEDTNYPLVISCIEPKGPAARLGLLQVGDRILSINSVRMEGVMLWQALKFVQEAEDTIEMEVEFDVTDAIVPTSGTFEVKMIKTATSNLGITINGSQQCGDTIWISKLKKGSVAYRMGMLQPGDVLLAINNQSLESANVRDAAQLLNNAGEIVTLQISKDNANMRSASSDQDSDSQPHTKDGEHISSCLRIRRGFAPVHHPLTDLQESIKSQRTASPLYTYGIPIGRVLPLAESGSSDQDSDSEPYSKDGEYLSSQLRMKRRSVPASSPLDLQEGIKSHRTSSPNPLYAHRIPIGRVSPFTNSGLSDQDSDSEPHTNDGEHNLSQLRTKRESSPVCFARDWHKKRDFKSQIMSNPSYVHGIPIGRVSPITPSEPFRASASSPFPKQLAHVPNSVTSSPMMKPEKDANRGAKAGSDSGNSDIDSLSVSESDFQCQMPVDNSSACTLS